MDNAVGRDSDDVARMSELVEKSKALVEQWLNDAILYRPEGATSVHLTRALGKLCGSPIEFPDEGEVGRLAELIGDHHHYLFILVDGLGMNQRERFPAGGFFEDYFAEEIRSVVPSTTSAALTSLASGQWPATHAIIGWFTHLPDYRTTIIPLKATERFSYRPISKLGFTLDDVMTVDSMLPNLERPVRMYTMRRDLKAEYVRWSSGDSPVIGYRKLEQAIRKIRKQFRGAASSGSSGDNSYAYFYYPDVDSLSHKFGRSSIEVAKEISRVDRELSRLRAALPDTIRMIVTADHGHLDVPEERHLLLQHDDPVYEYLECPHTGESRLPVFHVKPEMETIFVDAFSERKLLDFLLITPDQADELGIFGPEPLSPKTRERLGTYIGVSPSADALEYVPEGKEPVNHVGMHGGMSGDEVRVPLFLA